jgi:hypothetical protein
MSCVKRDKPRGNLSSGKLRVEPFGPALDKRLVVDPRALSEGFRRIEDLATGRVKGLTEAEFRRDIGEKH